MPLTEQETKDFLTAGKLNIHLGTVDESILHGTITILFGSVTVPAEGHIDKNTGSRKVEQDSSEDALGWLFVIPVPLILFFGTSWNWILFANVLLGINQGLAWSMTVNMKIDLVGKNSRVLALGLNEFSGYIAVALVGFLTGYLAAAYGLKPYPFYLGITFPILGLIISLVPVRHYKILAIRNRNRKRPNTKGIDRGKSS